MPADVHSTGRGGAGNIGSDPDTVYVDGDILREGVVGQPAARRGGGGGSGGNETATAGKSMGEYSAGRGGAGNIGSDPDTVYVDGDILREGVVGQPAAAGKSTGEYSAGRGGAGNMMDASSSPRVGPQVTGIVHSEDVIPETAMRTTHQENYHTGRGGEGNVHKDKYDGHSGPREQRHEHVSLHGLVDKAKHMVGMDKDKDKHRT